MPVSDNEKSQVWQQPTNIIERYIALREREVELAWAQLEVEKLKATTAASVDRRLWQSLEAKLDGRLITAKDGTVSAA